MGNVFCGPGEETNKGNQAVFVPEASLGENATAFPAAGEQQHFIQNQTASAIDEGIHHTTANINETGSSDLQQQQDSQDQWKGLVQATARSMVPIRTARDNYYDQGFAAALSQYLEQTTAFHDHVPIRLPPAAPTNTVVDLLMAAPTTTDVQQEQQRQLEELAEQWIDTLLPKKELLFSDVGPILENLL